MIKNCLNYLEHLHLTRLWSLCIKSVLAFFVCTQIHAQNPNILLITVDDLLPELPVYGDTHIIAPNMDRLSDKGLTFNRAYVQQAVCQASRASVMTGTRPDTTKIYSVFGGGYPTFRDTMGAVETLPGVFKDSGTYQVESHGKAFHHQDTGSWHVDQTYYSAGLYQDPNNSGKPVTENYDGNEADYMDGKVADNVVAAIATHAASGTPFFISAGFWKPHLPWAAPKPYWDLYDRTQDAEGVPGNVPVVRGVDGLPVQNGLSGDFHDGFSGEYSTYNATRPGFVGQTQATKDALANGTFDLNTQPGIITINGDTHIYPEDYIRESTHGYFACISFIDAQIGKLLDALDDPDGDPNTADSIADNTIVVLWSDHGFSLNHHGRWAKHNNLEQSNRVPFIVFKPGMSETNQKSDAIVEMVDIYPTLLELAGLSAPAHSLEGKSLVPLLDDKDLQWKTAAFSQYPRQVNGSTWFMGYAMKTDGFRYVEWREMISSDGNPVTLEERNFTVSGEVSYQELFNHSVDPNENIDFARDPDYVAVVNAHAEMMPAAVAGDYSDFQDVNLSGTHLPEAQAVSMYGGVNVGDTLNASYIYDDDNGDPEAGSTIEWLSGSGYSAAGSGAVVGTGTTYTLQAGDAGNFIRLRITPKNATETGTAVVSTYAVWVDTVAFSGTDSPPVASALAITGNHSTGDLLTGHYTYSDVDMDTESGTTFRWLRSDTENGTYSPISGATGTTYTLQAADSGKYIRFEVTPGNMAVAAEVNAQTYGDPVQSVAIFAGDNLLHGLVAHYTFEDANIGSLIADSSGNGNDVSSISGTPSAGSAPAGQTFLFDGSNDFFSIPLANTTYPRGFTLAVWAKGDASGLPVNSNLATIRTGDSDGFFLMPGMNAGGVNMRAWPGPGESIDYTATLQEVSGSWAHWVLTKDAASGIAELYRNGVKVADTTGATSSVVIDSHSSTGDGIQVGKYWSGYYKGEIDDYRIYDRKLTATEVALLHGTTDPDTPPTNAEINILGAGQTIGDGSTSPTTANHTDFGNVNVGGTTSRTFTVQNLGSAELTLGTPVLSGAGATAFSITANPAATVAGSSSTSFTVEFSPVTIQSYEATITLSNNDADEASYDFAIKGFGFNAASELQVYEGFEGTTVGFTAPAWTDENGRAYSTATDNLATPNGYGPFIAGSNHFTPENYYTGSRDIVATAADFSSDGTFYISAVMHTSAGTNASASVFIRLASSWTTLMYFGSKGGNANFGAYDASNASLLNTEILNSGNPTLLVMKVTTSAAGNDSISFSTFETTDNVFPEPTTWEATGSVDIDSPADRLYLTGEWGYKMDEIRIGSTYLSVVGEESPKNIWKVSHFEDPNVANTGDQEDFDEDGIINLLEFALHLDPTLNNHQPSDLPRIEIVESEGESYIDFIYTRRKGTGSGNEVDGYTLDGLQYLVQTSVNLKEEPVLWDTGSDLLEVVGDPEDNGDGSETVTLRVSQPVDEQTQRFLRMNLTTP